MSDALKYSETQGWTYADYKSWELKEGERYEIIYGQAYAMSAPNTLHQLVLMEISKQIAVFLTGKPCKVIPAPFDVRLFYEEDESDDTVVQPDITIICDKDKLGKEGCHGAPEFVLEILSPSNSAIEMHRKYNVYQDAGVLEYWIVDPVNKQVTVNIFTDEDPVIRKYGEKDKVPVSAVQGLVVDMESVFAQ